MIDSGRILANYYINVLASHSVAVVSDDTMIVSTATTQCSEGSAQGHAPNAAPVSDRIAAETPDGACSSRLKQSPR
jgi:hypothetical protein